MILPRKPHAVIFDMDGLIVDTEVLHQEATIAAVAANGHTMAPSLYRGTIGMPSDAAREALVRHYGQTFDIDAVWAEAGRRFHALTETRR